MKTALAKIRFVGVLVVAAMLLGASCAAAATILKASDRVVFFGDSITQQQLYTRYVQQYIYCRYPELKVRFFNAGWNGDTAGGAVKRLDRDVLSLTPTVVTLFFGMNDGGYKPIADDTLKTYRTNMEALIKALQARDIHVVVFTPGCCDPDRDPNLAKVHYNDTLEALGKTAMDLARTYDCPYVDVFHPMLAYQNAQKAKSSSFTMIPDGIHPNPVGHLLMANSMLRGFGVDPMPPLATVDVKANQATGASLVGNGSSKVTLYTAPTNVPFWVDPAFATAVALTDDLFTQKLVVKGLDAGKYRVTIANTKTMTTAAALDAGLSIVCTNSVAGSSIHDLALLSEAMYFSEWRQFRLPYSDTPGAKTVVDGLSTATDGIATMIYAQKPSSASQTITIEQVQPTANVALEMPYECSDPNEYNWGIGGLTDGSWDATSDHCFASGDSDSFPKTATIDLLEPEQVGSVIAGVPPFGATKTIQVSLSSDGVNFQQVGSHLFAPKTEAKFTYSFPETSARYIRLTYPDHYSNGNGYANTFVFTTEVEAYAAKE